MFTSKERVQLDRLLKEGFIDSFREFEKNNGNYTWWPYMADARKRNLGWRIDYCFVSSDLKKRIEICFYLPRNPGIGSLSDRD